MRALMVLAAIGAFAVSALGFLSVRSDIQLIVAFIGLFSGFILLGLASVLGKLSRAEN